MAKGFGQGDVGIDYGVGAEVITDTAAHTGLFKHIDFFENTTITALTSKNYTGNSLDGETLPSGFHIVGVFTSIQLQNGACIAYRI
jgi:hypothetical protein